MDYENITGPKWMQIEVSEVGGNKWKKDLAGFEKGLAKKSWSVLHELLLWKLLPGSATRPKKILIQH